MVILSRRNANEKTREGRRFSQSTLYQVMKEESFHNPEIRATMAGCCLLDQKRTFSLMEIVDKNTKEGETAIDIGAGCGPLAFSFLNAGGDMVTAVEKSPELCQALDDTSIRLGLRDRIEIINADILDLDWILPTDIGFVMAELIGTGLLAEPMVPAMRHIRPFLREDAVFIPEQAISTVTLCDTDGFPISAPQVYDHVNMRDIDRVGVDTEVTFTVRTEKGKESAETIRLNTRLLHPDGEETEEFHMLCNPLHSCISDARWNLTPIEVRNGQEVRVRIVYTYGREDLLAMPA